MRTTVIPAQITTVEDRIAANLNLTQIILLLSSLFVATFIYAMLPHRLSLTFYKYPLFVLNFLLFISLSMRIKGRVALNWLFVLSAYYFRPRYYVFNKNDVTSRDIVLPVFSTKKSIKASYVKESNVAKKIKLAEQLIAENILNNPNAKISFKKGGVNVYVQKV
jgi:hypothetical protein